MIYTSNCALLRSEVLLGGLDDEIPDFSSPPKFKNSHYYMNFNIAIAKLGQSATMLPPY